MSRFIIAKYIRLSLDDAITESLSIPNQHLLLDRYIEELEIPEIEVLEFVDNGFTGANLNRPAFQEMLDLVCSGRINCIVTKDFSRFSRNAIESGYYIEQVFPLYRIRFIAVSDGYDSDDYKNSTGGIEVAFKFLMHEHYSLDLSKKVKSAKRAKMQRGDNIVANAVYGYRRNDSGKWEPDPEAADVVRLIFQMALAGTPTAQIRDKLCAAYYPTPREYIETRRFQKDIDVGCVWTARMVITILENEQYMGSYVTGKWEQKSIGGGQIHTDKSKWLIIPDSHPPIISKADFAAVQEWLGRYKGSTTTKPLENLLQDEGRSKRRRMVSGQWIAATPIYGYLKAACGNWEIDDAAADVVRKIFEMGLQGKSYDEICLQLTEQKHPTPAENVKITKGRIHITPLCQWKKKSVRAILQNIQYTGAFVSGKELMNGETGKRFHTAKSDWIVVPDRHPAIISKTVFDEMQDIIAQNKYRRQGMRQRDYLLRGNIVKCACCGYGLHYDDSRNVAVHYCHHTVATPDADCYKMKIVAAELDEAVLTIIKKQAEVVLNTTDLSGYRKASADVRRIDECGNQIRHIIEQQQICYERFIRQEISQEEFQALKSKYSEQVECLNNQLALLRQMERDKDADKKVAAVAKEVLSETATPRDIVTALVDKIFVTPDNRIEIRWKFANFAM